MPPLEPLEVRRNGAQNANGKGQTRDPPASQGPQWVGFFSENFIKID